MSLPLSWKRSNRWLSQASVGGCGLITTNDNIPAIKFYQRRGWTKVATYHGAVAESRRLKPELPEIGRGRIPIRDEIEFELRLRPGGA